MSRLPGVAQISVIISLTIAWCALWGEATLANVISGALVSTVGVLLSASGRPTRSVRPLALVKLLVVIVVDLVKSTVAVAAEVLTPTDRTDETMIAVDVTREALDHLMLLVVAITVTPGTAVVDVDVDAGRLYLHLLHADSAPKVIEHVERLTHLADAAFPAHVGRTATHTEVPS